MSGEVMASRQKIRVGVIFGGRSGEHEVSLMSARSVIGAMDLNKYLVTEIGITHDGAWVVGNDVLAGLTKEQTSGLSPAAILADPTARQGSRRPSNVVGLPKSARLLPTPRIALSGVGRLVVHFGPEKSQSGSIMRRASPR